MAGIKDVAARAGVSISTVSYVVSGKRRIGAETQARVRAAALELGYRLVIDATKPASARGTHVLAVSSPLRPYTDVANYAAFFFALATAAKRHGYDILLLMHEAGDHMIIVGRDLHAQITEGDPLAFFGGQIAGIARG